MEQTLKDLYQEIILDHNKKPRNFQKLEPADYEAEGYNPLCGDHYWFYANTDGEVVREIGFQGSGCAISKSSASIMTTLAKGKTRQEVDALFQMFRAMLTREREVGEAELGKLAAFGGVSEHPSRIKCAILPWHTLSSALAGEKKTTTE